MDTQRLFRPLGLHELLLVLDADARGFPPRRPEQPIFYPVLDEEYADEIAARWNPSDEASGVSGFVTAFDVATSFVAAFDAKIVGAARHRELWIPAERLADMNASISGRVRVLRAFYGARYVGPAGAGRLERVPLVQQPEVFAALSASERGEELARNWKLIVANGFTWPSALVAELARHSAVVRDVLRR